MSLTAAALRRVAVAAQTLAAGGIAAGLAKGLAGRGRSPSARRWCAVLLGFGIGVGIAFAATLGGSGIPRTRACPIHPTHHRASRSAFSGALACYLSECRAVFRMFNWLQPFRSRITFCPARQRQCAPDRAARARLRLQPRDLARTWRPHWPPPAIAAKGSTSNPCWAISTTTRPPCWPACARSPARTGQPPLVVCHSMGGLAARAAQVLALREAEVGAEPTPPCAGIVTLGSAPSRLRPRPLRRRP